MHPRLASLEWVKEEERKVLGDSIREGPSLV